MDKKSRAEFKSLVYEQFAGVGKAFSNAHRLEIIDLLAQTPHTVEELANKMSLSIASTSQHLQVLKSAKLVNSKREGTYIWYRLANDKVFAIWKAMREFALDARPEIDRLMHDHYEDRFTLRTITASELVQRMSEEDVIILDVRPRDEFQAGHLPNAVNIPVDELDSSLQKLPTGAKIIAYCRASYCLLSDMAALLLKDHGYDVEVFQDGFPEWRIQGLPYETESTQD